MQINTVYSISPTAFDESVNKFLREGWNLDERIVKVNNNRIYYIAHMSK